MLTVPAEAEVRPFASASTPTMVEISWIRDLTSRGLALAERSWESFARTHGWVETWTLGGNEAMVDGGEDVRELGELMRAETRSGEQSAAVSKASYYVVLSRRRKVLA